jgi:hypothetical protein
MNFMKLKKKSKTRYNCGIFERWVWLDYSSAREGPRTILLVFQLLTTARHGASSDRRGPKTWNPFSFHQRWLSYMYSTVYENKYAALSITTDLPSSSHFEMIGPENFPGQQKRPWSIQTFWLIREQIFSNLLISVWNIFGEEIMPCPMNK